MSMLDIDKKMVDSNCAEIAFIGKIDEAKSWLKSQGDVLPDSIVLENFENAECGWLWFDIADSGDLPWKLMVVPDHTYTDPCWHIVNAYG